MSSNKNSKFYEIPQTNRVEALVSVPSSKSISNRALLIAAMTRGRSALHNLLESVDTEMMTRALVMLGAKIEKRKFTTFVDGFANGPLPCSETLYIENAGTAARFLTCALLHGQGTYRLDGNERMRQRPILDLIESLRGTGYKVIDEFGNGCPPLLIQANSFTGGEFVVPGKNSSQFVSSIMIAGAFASGDTKIQIKGPSVSETYIRMTAATLGNFGLKVDFPENGRIYIPGGQTAHCVEMEIEPDASSASYFFALAAITGGTVKVLNTKKITTQGDIGLVELLGKMGCEIAYEKDGIKVTGGNLKGIEVDMNSMSDVAPTLAMVGLFAEGTTVISNVANMRIKECDRIQAITAELRKLGAEITELPDGLIIKGNRNYHGASLDTYDDHRMAMAFSLAGLRIKGVKINDPDCVSKTFPNYFNTLGEAIGHNFL